MTKQHVCPRCEYHFTTEATVNENTLTCPCCGQLLTAPPPQMPPSPAEPAAPKQEPPSFQQEPPIPQQEIPTYQQEPPTYQQETPSFQQNPPQYEQTAHTYSQEPQTPPQPPYPPYPYYEEEGSSFGRSLFIAFAIVISILSLAGAVFFFLLATGKL